MKITIHMADGSIFTHKFDTKVITNEQIAEEAIAITIANGRVTTDIKRIQCHENIEKYTKDNFSLNNFICKKEYKSNVNEMCYPNQH